MTPQAKTSTTRQILVVEDEKEIRDLMKQTIASMGHKPLEACNIKEALAHIVNWGIDLMLLDLHLGGADGRDLLKLLNRRRWKVPTLVVSAYVSLEVTKELMDLGVTGIVAKPFKRERLVNEIQRMIRE